MNVRSSIPRPGRVPVPGVDTDDIENGNPVCRDGGSMEGADAGAQARHRRCFLGVRMMADREPVTRNKERCFEVSDIY